MANQEDFRQLSRGKWTTAPGQQPTDMQLMIGCAQRMADATEMMAQPYLKLLEDVERYRRMYNNKQEELDTMTRSRNTYKGKYNHLKKELESLKGLHLEAEPAPQEP